MAAAAAQAAAAAANAVATGNQQRRQLKDLKILGEQEEFLTWLPRLEGRMRVLGYGDMLLPIPAGGAAVMPGSWPAAKEMIMDSCAEPDRQIIMDVADYHEAIALLKSVHIPSVEIAQYHKRHEFNSLRLKNGESVAQLVGRARTLKAHLALLGRQLTEEQVLDAVTAALSNHPSFASHLATLVAIQPPGQAITIPLLVKAFGSMPTTAVPGAMLAAAPKSASKQPVHVPASTPAPVPIPDEVKEMMKVMTALASRVQQDTSMAMSITAKTQGGGAPSPAPDRAGPATKEVTFNPYVQQDGHPRTEPRQDSTRGRGAPRGHQRGNGGHNRGGRGYRGGRGRWGPRDTDRDRDRSPIQPISHCMNCSATDHVIRDCRENCGECGSRDHMFPSCPGNRAGRKFNPHYQYTRVPSKNDAPPSPRRGGHAYYAEHSRNFGECNLVVGPDHAVHDDVRLPLDMPTPWDLPGLAPMDLDIQQPSLGMADGYAFMTLDDDGGPPPGYGMASAAALTVDSKNPTYAWILDSGASHHVTPYLDQLHDVVWDVHPVDLLVANKQYLQRKAVGSLRVTTVVEGITHDRVIPGVWYVPGLSRSLLSVNQLKQAGNWHIGGVNGNMNELWFAHDAALPWLECSFNGYLSTVDWTVHLNPSPPSANMSYSQHCDANATVPPWEAAAYIVHANRATEPETPALWHQRLGHVSTRTLTDLVKH